MVWQAVPATLFTETPRRDQPTTKTSALPVIERESLSGRY
jgi:hypothetical protein